MESLLGFWSRCLCRRFRIPVDDSKRRILDFSSIVYHLVCAFNLLSHDFSSVDQSNLLFVFCILRFYVFDIFFFETFFLMDGVGNSLKTGVVVLLSFYLKVINVYIAWFYNHRACFLMNTFCGRSARNHSLGVTRWRVVTDRVLHSEICPISFVNSLKAI